MAATLSIGGFGTLNLTTYPELIISGEKPMKIKGINGIAGTQTEYVMGQASNVKCFRNEDFDVSKLKALRDVDVLITLQDGKKFNMVGCSINSDFPEDTEKSEIDLGVIEANEAYYI